MSFRAALFLLFVLQLAQKNKASARLRHRVGAVIRSSDSHHEYHHSETTSRRSHRASPAISALISSSLATPLSYDAALLNKWGFKRVRCGRGDFLVADTGMVDNWICTAQGEKLVTAAMDEILSIGCRKRNGRSGDSLFLDIGSNTGFYGLNAISHGCVASFFDVQPGCNKVVNAALLVNGFGDRGVVMAAGLSDRSDSVRASSSSNCSFESGRFPITAIETNTLMDGDVDVPVLPLSRLLQGPLPSTKGSSLSSSSSSSTTEAAAAAFLTSFPRVFMMKIDTEGLEQRVLAGAMPLFKERAIEHVIVEVTPGGGFWEKRGVVPADVPDTMRDIAACGYSFTRLSTKRKTSKPERVHELFSKRNFEQEDFLISKM